MLTYSLTTFRLESVDDAQQAFVIRELSLSPTTSFLTDMFHDYKSVRVKQLNIVSRPEIIEYVFLIPVVNSYTRNLTFRYHVASGCGRVMSHDKRHAVIFRVTSDFTFHIFLIENKYGASMMLLQDLKDGQFENRYGEATYCPTLTTGERCNINTDNIS